MKKMKNLLYLTIALLIISCHAHDEADVNAPKLTITAPTKGDFVKNNTDMKISGTITDESLHELSIKILTKSNNTVLFTSTPEVHDKTSYSINETWKPSLTADTTQVYLAVEVYDHNDNKSADTISFNVIK